MSAAIGRVKHAACPSCGRADPLDGSDAACGGIAGQWTHRIANRSIRSRQGPGLPAVERPPWRRRAVYVRETSFGVDELVIANGSPLEESLPHDRPRQSAVG